MAKPRTTSGTIIFILLLCALASPFASAQRGHLTLLTAAESDDQPLRDDQGGVADVYLEIRPGTGQVFLDTFPLTHLDTQSSTRFAKEVACSYIDADCSRYDFFYTIRADSSVIGGPSASGPIAVLTAAMLEDKALDPTIVMTGTINAGGLIGPVAGIKAKGAAAAAHGFKTMLISSFGEVSAINDSYLRELNLSRSATAAELANVTLNISRLYAPLDITALGIRVEEVGTLGEALARFTGEAQRSLAPLANDPAYDRIMEYISKTLCDRRDTLEEQLNRTGALNVSDTRLANGTQKRAQAALRGDSYSLASFCFSELIALRGQSYVRTSQPDRQAKYEELRSRLAVAEQDLDAKPTTTLAQLETVMIVAERLREARMTLDEEDRSNISAKGLGFAEERLNSADIWLAFYSMESPHIALDDSQLSGACTAKLVEAEERINYAELYVPKRYLAQAHEELDYARGESQARSFPRCLFDSAKAQAEADMIMGALSVPQERLSVLVDKKLSAVDEAMRRQQTKGYFPILGYSYLQYARSLAIVDPSSSLTFSEYALELSNLDMYFPRQQGFRLPVELWPLVLLFVSALIIGVVVGAIIAIAYLNRKRPKGAPQRRQSFTKLK